MHNVQRFKSVLLINPSIFNLITSDTLWLVNQPKNCSDIPTTSNQLLWLPELTKSHINSNSVSIIVCFIVHIRNLLAASDVPEYTEYFCFANILWFLPICRHVTHANNIHISPHSPSAILKVMQTNCAQLAIDPYTHTHTHPIEHIERMFPTTHRPSQIDELSPGSFDLVINYNRQHDELVINFLCVDSKHKPLL